MSYLNRGLMSSVGQTQNTDIMWKCRGNAVGLSCIKQPYPCAGNLSHALTTVLGKMKPFACAPSGKTRGTNGIARLLKLWFPPK